jgi:hypothetical protein
MGGGVKFLVLAVLVSIVTASSNSAQVTEQDEGFTLQEKFPGEMCVIAGMFLTPVTAIIYLPAQCLVKSILEDINLFRCLLDDLPDTLVSMLTLIAGFCIADPP